MRKQRENKESTFKSGQSGFTLFELVLSAVLMFVVLGAVALFIKSAYTRNSSIREAGELDERRSVVSELLRADFEGAGRNLVSSDNFGSGTENLTFIGNVDYSSDRGAVYRNSQTYETNIYSTRLLQNGTGQFSFSPSSEFYGTAYFLEGRDTTTSDSYFLIEGSSWSVYDSGQVAARGDRYRTESFIFQIENSAIEGRRVLAYYAVERGQRTLLYRNEEKSLSGPFSLGFNFNVGQQVENATVTGAPLVYRTAQPPIVPQLPYDSDVRMDGPVYITTDKKRTDKVTLFSGDANTDVARITNDWRDDGMGGGTIYFSSVSRGEFKEGDVVMLINFDDRATALYRVSSADMGEGSIKVQPVGSENPAWGRLWSGAEDYSASYPAGSSLVKVAPPVDWQVRADDSGRFVLMRREGDGAWTIADLAVNNFTVRVNDTESGKTFDITIVIGSEGIESAQNYQDAATQNFTLTLAPRALNVTYNTVNQ